MGIGLGITLMVIGAILSFTTLDSEYIGTNLNTVGWILLGGGVLAIILGLIQNTQRTRTEHTVVRDRRGGSDVVERDVIDRGDDPRV